MGKLTIIILSTLLWSFNSYSVFKNLNREQDFVQGEVIVKFENGFQFNQKKIKELRRAGLKLKRKLSLLAGDFAIFELIDKVSVEEKIQFFNQTPKKMRRLGFSSIGANFIYKVIAPQTWGMQSQVSNKKNDPMFDQLWGLKNTGDNMLSSSMYATAGADINALNAWKVTQGSRNIKIAVIDTGVDYNHEDLSQNIWINHLEARGVQGVDDDGNGFIDDIHGYDFANNDGDPMDGNGHGTHCSGTIAALHDNGVGVAGVMAKAQIIGVKFLTDAGSGTTANAMAAIDYAIKVGADIMNNSWGGGGFSQALRDVIESANKAGIIFTAAAGNLAGNNDRVPHYPSNYDLDNVVSVAAHNNRDELARFSNYGSKTVHIAAPGKNILSTVPGNLYNTFSGTSMAAPHVTGVIGLYLSHHGKKDPKALRDALMASSVYAGPYSRTLVSGGRVDAYQFLKGMTSSRPERPDPRLWRAMRVSPFESSHPYLDESQETRTYTIVGAKFIRAIIKRHDLEAKYDYLSIQGGQGVEVQRVDGVGKDIRTEYISGDTLKVEFYSDNSVNGWGYLIEKLEVIYH